VTVFSDSSQLPKARVGDLGIFRLFSAASAFMEIEMLRALQVVVVVVVVVVVTAAAAARDTCQCSDLVCTCTLYE